ncbi:hypothetical protein LX36DRAFT_391056 [Colletotrichum falcatum]|nr:hypothetical protein LX36DRAFT_391056 [Colletotrichum falcatum]
MEHSRVGSLPNQPSQAVNPAAARFTAWHRPGAQREPLFMKRQNMIEPGFRRIDACSKTSRENRLERFHGTRALLPCTLPCNPLFHICINRLSTAEARASVCTSTLLFHLAASRRLHVVGLERRRCSGVVMQNMAQSSVQKDHSAFSSHCERGKTTGWGRRLLEAECSRMVAALRLGTFSVPRRVEGSSLSFSLSLCLFVTPFRNRNPLSGSAGD